MHPALKISESGFCFIIVNSVVQSRVEKEAMSLTVASLF